MQQPLFRPNPYPPHQGAKLTAPEPTWGEGRPRARAGRKQSCGLFSVLNARERFRGPGVYEAAFVRNPKSGCKADRARTDGALRVRPVSRPPRGGGTGAVRFAWGKSDGENRACLRIFTGVCNLLIGFGDHDAHVEIHPPSPPRRIRVFHRGIGRPGCADVGGSCGRVARGGDGD